MAGIVGTLTDIKRVILQRTIKWMWKRVYRTHVEVFTCWVPVIWRSASYLLSFVFLSSSLLFSADFETSLNSHISHNHSNSKLNPEEFGWRIGCRVYRILLKCWSDLDLICWLLCDLQMPVVCDLRTGPPLVCVRFNPLIRETHSDGKRQECSSDWVWISKWDVIDEMDLFDGK